MAQYSGHDFDLDESEETRSENDYFADRHLHSSVLEDALNDNPIPELFITPICRPSSQISRSNPGIDARVRAVNDLLSLRKSRPINTVNEQIMERLATCRIFSGYSTDNAKKFLAEFESYATLHNIHDHKRKVAAFHLHLAGPALSWFNGLDNATKGSWILVERQFAEKYVTLGHASPTIMYETEIFNSITLQPTQSIEDFYSTLSEKGQTLGKADHEVMARFISALPEKLAFFVRAGSPKDAASALSAAKMGESCGYRSHSQDGASPTVAAVRDGKQSEVAELREQVANLTLLVQSIAGQGNAGVTSSRRTGTTSRFFFCQGEGHLRRECNSTGEKSDPSIQCQVCFQMGHPALQCRRFTSVPPPAVFPGIQNQRQGGNQSLLGKAGGLRGGNLLQ